MTDAKTLYQEVILVHGKTPHHEGPLEGATHQATVKNPLCGDRITLRLRVDPATGVVEDASFEARGCMIARASASLLTDAVIGLPRKDALALLPFVEETVGSAADPARAALPEPLSAASTERAHGLAPLRGAREFPARRACVLLTWRALAACFSAQAIEK